MRLQASHPLVVRGQVLGGPLPLVCIPLVGKNREVIAQEGRNISVIRPDIVELRIDAWDFVEDVEQSVAMISSIRDAAGALPIILTCRGHWEGGFKEVSDEAKFRIYERAVERGLVDFIDVELAYGEQKIGEVRRLLSGTSVFLIVSSHDFKKTAAEEELRRVLTDQIRAGADVAKLAVMPQREEDVLTLLSATLAVRRAHPGVPLITMSMGGLGAVSRVVGGHYGSDLTFAVGSQASAPGQIPVDTLRQCLSVLYPKE